MKEILSPKCWFSRPDDGRIHLVLLPFKLMSRTPRNNCLETPRTAGKLRSSDKVHCGSSLLQETHKLKLHSLSHAVEFHAKAALALRQKSNPVAHHVVKHFQHQKEAHAKGEKPHKKHLVKAMKKIQKVASPNLTKVQVARHSWLGYK